MKASWEQGGSPLEGCRRRDIVASETQPPVCEEKEENYLWWSHIVDVTHPEWRIRMQSKGFLSSK